jgi:hypothetical protein
MTGQVDVSGKASGPAAQQVPWSSPVFPYLGWVILGWILTWAAVELNMLQRLLDTTSLSAVIGEP